MTRDPSVFLRLTLAGATLLFLAGLPVDARAQSGGASVSGNVTDETGAALPGATITVTNRSNGFVQTFVTGSEGNYRAVALQPAPYEVRAELAGFATVKRDVVLVVGAAATIDLKLGLASLAETLTVTGESPLVEVTKSQPSSYVTGDQLKSMPVLSRNFQVLAQLMPGAAPVATSASTCATCVVTKFGGVADQRNGFTTIIDGGTVDDHVWGSPVINMSQEAIQEFRVFRNQFGAEYGAALAAVVTVVTKAGGNDLSGSGFYFGRDEALNATNAFATVKPPFQQTRVGGSFGGPIVKNKTHYFVAYEHLKYDSAVITALPASVPYAGLENGTYPNFTRTHNADARVDHRFSNAHSMYVRYALDNQRLNGAKRPDRVDVVPGLVLGSSTSNQISHSHSLVAEENWVLSSRIVNTARMHLLKHTVGVEANSFEPGVIRPSFSWGQPRVYPQFMPRQIISLSDAVYFTTPRHSFKFGADYAQSTAHFEAHFNEHGLFTFLTDASFNSAIAATWPFQFGLGKPGNWEYSSSQIAGYLQDDWRVLQNVRVNLGLRYDLDTNLRNKEFVEAVYRNPPAGIENFVSRDRGNDYSALQPRIGAVWDVRGNGRLVGRAGWGLYVTRNRPWFQLEENNETLGSQIIIQDPQQLRFFPDINAVLGGRDIDAYLAAGGVRALTVVSNDYRLPRQINTTVGLGWQLTDSVSLDADYVHGYGSDELGLTDKNLPATGTISAANPRPVPLFSTVKVTENYGKSWYDALEVQVRTRVRGGHSLQAAYTYSRAMLDGVDFYNIIRGTERTPQEYGYNTSDTPHNLVFSGSAALPFGLQLSGIVRYLSGTPKKVAAGIDLDGDLSAVGDRPRGLTPTVGRGDVDRQLELINAFRVSQGFPAVDPSLLKLDSFKQLDLRATKALRLGGSRRLELFLEAFNLPNFVNRTGGGSNMRTSAFLIRTGAADARQIQWGARYSF